MSAHLQTSAWSAGQSGEPAARKPTATTGTLLSEPLRLHLPPRKVQQRRSRWQGTYLSLDYCVGVLVAHLCHILALNAGDHHAFLNAQALGHTVVWKPRDDNGGDILIKDQTNRLFCKRELQPLAAICGRWPKFHLQLSRGFL